MGLRHALKVGLLPAILVAVPLLLTVGGERLRVALRFDRTGIEAGEWYRLLTGHFTHLGWSHVALNAVGLGLCWLLVGQAYTLLQWLFVIAVCLVVMDLGFWLLVPELEWYVGLSGLLHGMLAAGALEGIRRRSPEQALVLAIIVIKVVYESVTGPLPGSEQATGGPVVTEAHLFGMVGGLLASAILMIGNRRPAPI
jgi:rhomboid family GlyGly-CTERM serine protease